MAGRGTAAQIAGPALAGMTSVSRTLPPSDFAGAVSWHARLLGAVEAVVYRLDYARTHLMPLPGPDAADRQQIAVEGSLAGRAFVTNTPTEGEAPPDAAGSWRLWVPVVDGTERIGMLELTFPTAEPVPEQVRGACELYAAQLATLLLAKGRYGDVFEFVRRREPLTVAAEVQWQLLPPLSFTSDAVVVAGALEPCDSVAGDSFDYAVNGETAHLGMFDGLGHGLASGMLATIAVGAYRNARRRLLDLPQTHRWIEETVASQSLGERFVTGLLADLDLATGRLRWLSAGHPAPLLLRAGRMVKQLETTPVPPLGLELGGDPEIGVEALQPGDRVVVYTDGLVEARDRTGAFFGVDRLVDLVIREAASGLPPAEVLRRLTRAVLQHVEGRLDDDASILMVEWCGS